jgi:hypothetical protein
VNQDKPKPDMIFSRRLAFSGFPSSPRLLFSRFVFCFVWLAALALSPARAEAGGTRGIWWWASPDHPWGTEQVLGDSAKETVALDFLKAWNVDRLYCSFSEPKQAQPAVVRAWNERVHAAGMTSQLLLGENSWIYPGNRLNLLTVHIQRGLIGFNAACTNSQHRFDGLHLDIEPHGLPGWKTMTPAERKKLLLLLRDTFAEVRSYLDARGATNIPVYADLPVWYDQVGKPVGWESASERDAWFADLAQSLAGISLMAYERDTAPQIEDGVIWEIQHFKGEVRVGLEVSLGLEKSKTWKSFADFTGMMQAQERVVPSRAVDIHDFVQFYDAAQGRKPPAQILSGGGTK